MKAIYSTLYTDDRKNKDKEAGNASSIRLGLRANINQFLLLVCQWVCGSHDRLETNSRSAKRIQMIDINKLIKTNFQIAL